MKIELKIFLPMLSEVIGTDELAIEFDGRTAADLLGHLTKAYGKKGRDALLDDEGKLDVEVQLLRNRKDWITQENIDTELRDGDHVTIMVLMAGG
jgi:molybdopterin converting factor small subunit